MSLIETRHLQAAHPPARALAPGTGLATLHRYWDRASCQACLLKPRCTPSVERRITRWEHEATLEAMQRRMDLAPTSMMKLRRRIVEHPFGTIKAWMGHELKRYRRAF